MDLFFKQLESRFQGSSGDLDQTPRLGTIGQATCPGHPQPKDAVVLCLASERLSPKVC